MIAIIVHFTVANTSFRRTRTLMRVQTILIATFFLMAEPSIAQQEEWVPGEILVSYKSNVLASSIDALEKKYSLIELRRFDHLRVVHYQIPQSLTVEKAVEKLSSEQAVEHVEPNYLRRLQEFPTDPRFSQMWGLHNTGQLVNGSIGPSDIDIDWPEATDLHNPLASIVVAVIDSGVALDHPELLNRIWINPGEVNLIDGVDNDQNGYIDDLFGWDFFDNRPLTLDENGHGTLVASIVAGEKNNGEGALGVSPNTLIMPLRVLNDFGRGAPGLSVVTFLLSTTYAAENGAKIINASFGGAPFSATELSQIQWLNQQGILIVAAAGNGGPDGLGDNNDTLPSYPASYDSANIISVAAIDRSSSLALFSNYGSTSVDLAAPGKDVFGADLSRSVVVLETFESGAPGWTQGHEADSFSNLNWSLFSDATGNTWATDSLDQFFQPTNYQPFTNSWMKSPWIDLSDSPGTQLVFKVWFQLALFDYAILEYSVDGVTWNLLDVGWGTLEEPAILTYDLSRFDGQMIQLRFRLFSDSSLQADGVYVDDVAIKKVDVFQYDGTQYQYNDGTSFAAPFVTGIAALLWSHRPDLTHLEIKQFILDNVVVTPALTGKVASNGMVNAKSALEAIRFFRDADADQITDSSDNCPSTANTNQANSDGDSHGNICDDFPTNSKETTDSDSDGMGDNFENRFGLNPQDSSDAAIDSDLDGLTNLAEFEAGRNPGVNEGIVVPIINSILSE
ncbi:MAG: S8 family serine peptidase [Candidatus Hermodarchaeia archaeon]|jgi:subtilisin family serine protease